MLLSLDPGIRGCGAALFKDGKLAACKYVRNPTPKGDDAASVLTMAEAVRDWAKPYGFSANLGDAGAYAFEWPQVYTVGKLAGDPNDLLALVGVGCALAALLSPVPAKRYLPAAWKGQMKKDVCHRRILGDPEAMLPGRLDVEELAVARVMIAGTAGTLSHNVLDAIGIGLKYLNRFEPRRVLPG